MRGETVTVVTAGSKVDPYSQEAVESWDDADTIKREVLTVAPPEPRPSGEPVQDARNAVTSGWTLYLPAGDPIDRANRVRVRGIEYPVQGEPSDWGRGIVVQAYRTEG